MTSNIIEMKDVRKAYGKTEVLSGISLEVPKGSVLALLGPNGAGKTTTVNILTTLLNHDSGTVRIAGFDISKDPNKIRGLIGVTGQGVTVDDYLSGMQNLIMVGRLYRFSRSDARKRALELLEQFDLIDAANRPVKTYSGGMRRRLDLAASLVASPQILFLDEPTTGLDPESRTTMWNAIRVLVKNGTTLLLTTQYLEEAEALADKVAVINHGRIVAIDTPSQLKKTLGGERLEITLAKSSDANKVAQVGLVALPQVEKQDVFSFGLPEGKDGLKKATAILEQLATAAVQIEEYAIKRPTLEEAFIQLINKTRAGK